MSSDHPFVVYWHPHGTLYVLPFLCLIFNKTLLRLQYYHVNAFIAYSKYLDLELCFDMLLVKCISNTLQFFLMKGIL